MTLVQWLGAALVVLGIVLVLVGLWVLIRDTLKPKTQGGVGSIIGIIVEKFPLIGAGLVCIYIGAIMLGVAVPPWDTTTSPTPTPSAS